MADSLADFERDLKRALDESHDAFMGRYRAELEALAGLSKNEIATLTPDATALETYDKLMAVVKAASRRNISQAELKARIEALGTTAIAIAKKVAGLAAMFV